MPLEKRRLYFVNSALSYKMQEIFLAHFPLFASTISTAGKKVKEQKVLRIVYVKELCYHRVSAM